MNINLSQYIDLDSFGIYPTVMVSPQGDWFIVLMEWNGHEKTKNMSKEMYEDLTMRQDFLIGMFYDLHSEVGR